MAKKASKGGLKLVAGGPGRRPMTWRVSDQPALSQGYTFVPGVPTFVEPGDVPWFEDLENTGGRVFEVVPPDGAPVAQTAPVARGSAGQGATPASGGASGALAGATGGAHTGKPADTDKPASGAGQD